MASTRRTFTFGAAAAAVIGAGRARAQERAFKMRLGTPFLITHPGASRVAEACDKIRAETNGTVNIEV